MCSWDALAVKLGKKDEGWQGRVEVESGHKGGARTVKMDGDLDGWGNWGK